MEQPQEPQAHPICEVAKQPKWQKVEGFDRFNQGKKTQALNEI